jgi:hypothetical protein
MTSARDSHFEATGLAGAMIQELLNAILHAKEIADNQAMPIIQNAIGAAPSSEAGQNAAGMVQQISEGLEEMAGIANQAIAEMTRYGGGF